MEQLVFFLIMSLPVLLILFAERKKLGKYITLGLFTVLLASVWESIGVYFGLWEYHVYPQFLGVSIITLFAYFQFICISYFLADVVFRRFKND